MFDLPRETHRYLLEPITEKRHVTFDLMKRFINFTEKISKSKKDTLSYVYKKIKSDARSVTAKNLLTIKHLCNKEDIYNDSIRIIDCDSLIFRDIPAEEEWRVSLAKELIEARKDESLIENLNAEEIEAIMSFVCPSGPS